MRIISATSRVTCGLIGLSISVWLAAFSMGMFPDRERAVVEGRAALAKNLALHCSAVGESGGQETIAAELESLVARRRDIESVAVRSADGALPIVFGKHIERWSLPADSPSTPSQMRVPLNAQGGEWQALEVRFRDLAPTASTIWLSRPQIALIIFVAAGTYLLYFCYLRKMLQHLDPSRVISNRVRETLNALAEGLLVLDTRERILLANQSFASKLGVPVGALTGLKASELPWHDEGGAERTAFPWLQEAADDPPPTGELLTLIDKDGCHCHLKVSVIPVFGEDGEPRGVMASFDDVTDIEQNRKDLRQMLDSLSASRDAVHRHNLELERLVSRDPLTGCLNRRAFFTELQAQWSSTERHADPLACIMIDLDHFKSINDTHGHLAGDAVLEKTSQLLRIRRRPSDLVCRYGGEEFCVILPHADLDEACQIAEQIRLCVAESDFAGLSVTCSLGVSARSLKAADPQQLIDQADQALYVAKRSGRNRVARFDRAAQDDGEPPGEPANAGPVGVVSRDREGAEASPRPTIPFHTVTGLLSALAYRDPSTAEHSRRVAAGCAAVARHLMPASQAELLEVAALLHDIGKIGVPDSVLLKPGELTDSEWRLMRSHERVGVEIVQAAFSAPELAEVLRTCRAPYGGDQAHPGLPRGEAIPLSARILAIVDAYDSMTNRNSYRAPLERDQAFEELRRHAGQQFDPELVERFIETARGADSDSNTINSNNNSNSDSNAIDSNAIDRNAIDRDVNDKLATGALATLPAGSPCAGDRSCKRQPADECNLSFGHSNPTASILADEGLS